MSSTGAYAAECSCRLGFTGDRCTVAPVNPCDGVQCGNGVCAAGASGNHKCLCNAGFVPSPEGVCNLAPVEPTCNDGLQNLDESDVDCGGGCEDKCASGLTCYTSEDCDGDLVCGGEDDADSGVCMQATRPVGVVTSINGVSIRGITKQQFSTAMSQAYIDSLVLSMDGARDAIILRVKDASSSSRRQLQSSSAGIVVDSEVIFHEDVTEQDASAQVTAATATPSSGGGASALQTAVQSAAERAGLGSAV